MRTLWTEAGAQTLAAFHFVDSGGHFTLIGASHESLQANVPRQGGFL